MKLADLAAASECSVATVKYYLREGLLHPGYLRSATEAEYDDSHLARLRMIRVLRDLGNVAIGDVKKIIAAIDDPSLPLPEKLGVAYYSLPPHPGTNEHIGQHERDEVLAFSARHGWNVTPDAPSVNLFAEALAAARAFWGPVGPEIFERYADALDTLARDDVDILDDVDDLSAAVRQVVVGTVVWDRAIIALRRLAADHYSQQRFGRP